MRLLTISLLALFSVAAYASDPECTKEPKDKWKDKTAFEKDLKDQGYKIKKFKVTKSNCYEIYGHDKDGKKVEIYFNPVTGEKVKEDID
jgi:hypothetical protein